MNQPETYKGEEVHPVLVIGKIYCTGCAYLDRKTGLGCRRPGQTSKCLKDNPLGAKGIYVLGMRGLVAHAAAKKEYEGSQHGHP